MKCKRTLSLEFIVDDDVEGRQSFRIFKDVIESAIISYINKDKKLITTSYKLQEVFENEAPRNIKL